MSVFFKKVSRHALLSLTPPMSEQAADDWQVCAAGMPAHSAPVRQLCELQGLLPSLCRVWSSPCLPTSSSSLTADTLPQSRSTNL